LQKSTKKTLNIFSQNKKDKSLTFIDLFAGAGGLSEGFIKAGFTPIAHIEMDKDACDTLKTRTAYHYLNVHKKLGRYYSYLKNKITRNDLWNGVPEELMYSIVNAEISDRTIQNIFTVIDKLLYSRKVDIIIGGPPCQAFSIVGRSRDDKGMRWDRRKFLFRYYAEFLKRYKPKFFVFENVLGLISAGNSKYLHEMLKLFSEAGYSTDYKILNSEDFGVLQRRRRVIIIGSKGKTGFCFPELPATENNWQIKKDLFYDLPKLHPGQELPIVNYTKNITSYLQLSGIRNGVNFTTQHITRHHNERDLEIYSMAIKKWLNERIRLKYTDLPRYLQTHRNIRTFLDRYKVVDPYGHSHTLVAHISKDGHYYIYPDSKQVRSLSVREAARIQSFPDDFYFEGGRTAAFKQIGNAVPPLMAEEISNTILRLL
jgi:DNA (cytosine-5)-methyltransferase 1